MIAGAIVLIPGAPLLAMTLTVNVIATLLMAPALLLLLLLANDREIMGDLANGWRANLAGGSIVVAISVIGALYGVITVFPDSARQMRRRAMSHDVDLSSALEPEQLAAATLRAAAAPQARPRRASRCS